MIINHEATGLPHGCCRCYFSRLDGRSVLVERVFLMYSTSLSKRKTRLQVQVGLFYQREYKFRASN